MANNSVHVVRWVIGLLVVAGLLVWGLSLFFPAIITKLTGLLVSLLLVVSGLFLRRKK